MAVQAQTKRISAIVAGAGAVENAWAPILSALQPFYDFPLTPDGANSCLARAVYLMRWWFSSSTIPEASEDSRDEFRGMSRWFAEIKKAIARELRAAEASGSIRARASLGVLMKKLVVDYGPDFGLLTTNWDTVISNAIISVLGAEYSVGVTPIYLHGNVTNPATLYLPSEITREPYRNGAEDQEVGVRHSTAATDLKSVTRTILYGLSLDPLDAELSMVLSAGWDNPNLEEVLIVDPNHQVIGHRVNLLLGSKRKIRVLGFNPETMDQEADYTIERYLGWACV